MIYLDSAATTLQKPPAVARAMAKAVCQLASPGRGGYPASMQAAEVAFRCREKLAELLDAEGPEQVVFTSSATHGLNIAIRSLVKPGARVVVSGYEHNAVTRTLADIPDVQVVRAAGELFDPEGDLAAFASALEQPVDAVICNHVSNVFGYVLPVEKIAALCRDRGVPLIVDASQSAGILDVKAGQWGAAYVAMPGHKGLYGPQGTGVLVCGANQMPVALLTGGTGSASREQNMPEELPDRLEAGTHNMPGIAGLSAGVSFVRSVKTNRILQHERSLAEMLKLGLSRLDRVEVIAPPASCGTGVISFRIRGMDCETASEGLARCGFCLRAGLHCAPFAHETAGTLDTGTIRASFSVFNTQREVEQLVYAVRSVAEK